MEIPQPFHSAEFHKWLYLYRKSLTGADHRSLHQNTEESSLAKGNGVRQAVTIGTHVHIQSSSMPIWSQCHFCSSAHLQASLGQKCLRACFVIDEYDQILE